MLRPRVVRFYPITSVFPKSENSSAADGDTVFLQISDGGNLIFNRVGAADQFGVTFRVGLQVHVIAPNTVVSKEPCGFCRQNTDRCTDFQFRKLVPQGIHRIQNLNKFLVRLVIPPAAGDDPDKANASVSQRASPSNCFKSVNPLHLKFRKPLLSIIAGAVFYMIPVQFVSV